jgi:hypothetical protein
MNNQDAVYTEAIVDYSPRRTVKIVDTNEAVEQLGVHPEHVPTLWDDLNASPTESWELSTHYERQAYEIWLRLNDMDTIVDTVRSKPEAVQVAQSQRLALESLENLALVWIAPTIVYEHNGVHWTTCEHDCDVAHGWIPIANGSVVAHMEDQWVRDDGYSNVPSPKL